MLAVELTVEAEGARDSLAMRGKLYEAEAIEDMLLCRLAETTASDKLQPHEAPVDNPKGIRCGTRSNIFHRRFSMDLQGGRVFTILGYLAKHAKSQSGSLISVRCGCTWNPAEIPYFENGEKIWELLSMARSIEARILARYDTGPDTGEGEEPVARLGLLQLIRKTSPISLQAVRCLPIDQVFRYIHETMLKGGSSAYGHTHTGCECLDSVQVMVGGSVSISEELEIGLKNLHLIVKTALWARLNGRGIQTRPLNSVIFARPFDLSLEDHSKDDLQAMHVISSAWVVWKPGRHPLLPDNPVMEILTKVEINSLSLNLAMDSVKFEELNQGVINGYSSQPANRFRVSKNNFIYFFGLIPVKHQLAPTWSIAHLKAWNNTLRREHSGYLFPKGATKEQILSDIIDLYAIGIMHGSQDIIDTLEDAVAGWGLWAPEPSSQALLEATQKITALSMDFAPYLLLKNMMCGYWFRHLRYDADIAPRLRLRAGFWENMLGDTKDIYDEPAKTCELYRQGYEAYACVTASLVPTAYLQIDLPRRGYDIRDPQIQRLARHLEYYHLHLSNWHGSTTLGQNFVAHRLLRSFPRDITGPEIASTVDFVRMVHHPHIYYATSASVQS
ncbi:uncharacterized protein DFL_009873 [Arthrobotrys flagrans]|uniref:Uncharacterized protein n=1 Tax=Arthrobotrys flagrans TaxID=97331 RepID=A0A436ZSY6_ARTFL|nr:hypothetical protein DFL_009873 [Arthrobotrys flagrans]